MGNRSGAEYNAEFRNLVAVAGMHEFHPIYRKFRQGLSTKALDLLLYAPIVTNMEDAYKQIIDVDERLEKHKQELAHIASVTGGSSNSNSGKKNQAQNNKPGNHPRPSAPSAASTPTPPKLPTGADPNAMEIDSFGKWKVTDKEKKRCQDNHLCLRCGQGGHFANACTNSGATISAIDSTPAPQVQGKDST